MKTSEIKKKLDNGEQWGFIKETDSEEYLGWVLINKMLPMRLVPRKEDYEDEESYSLVMKRYNQSLNQPYHVLIYELKRDVHERGGYETGDDVRLNDNYYFTSIEKLENFINELGYGFENIKHRLEIDAP
jgi:hypothetical protein